MYHSLKCLMQGLNFGKNVFNLGLTNPYLSSYYCNFFKRFFFSKMSPEQQQQKKKNNNNNLQTIEPQCLW